MTIGKLYHYEDARLNTELQRIYDYIAQGQIQSDNIDIPEVAAAIAPQLPTETSMTSVIPFEVDLTVAGSDPSDDRTVTVIFKDANGNRSGSYLFVCWTHTNPLGGPLALDGAGSMSASGSDELAQLGNDALLVKTDFVGRADITITNPTAETRSFIVAPSIAQNESQISAFRSVPITWT